MFYDDTENNKNDDLEILALLLEQDTDFQNNSENTTNKIENLDKNSKTEDDNCNLDELTILLESEKNYEEIVQNNEPQKCLQSHIDNVKGLVNNLKNQSHILSNKDINKSQVIENTMISESDELNFLKEKVKLLEKQLKDKESFIENSNKLPSPNNEFKEKNKNIVLPKCKPHNISYKQNDSISNQHSFSAALIDKSIKKTKIKSNEHALERNNSIISTDSDWEGLDGEKEVSLSLAGNEINKLLNQKSGCRVAHAPKFQNNEKLKNKLENIKKKEIELPSKCSIISIVGLKDSSSIETSYDLTSNSKKLSQEPEIREEFSGLRIIKPLVSSEHIKNLMKNRRMVKLSTLHSLVGSKLLEEDWVTIGVIVNKLEQKVSAKGKNYSIWSLSDLSDCQKPTVSFFLFDSVNSELWKTCHGSVIGLLNPTFMNKTEKSKSYDEISITIDNARKLMVIGTSRDLGVCKSKTKAGNQCPKFINLSQGEFCVYHIQAAYKKQAAKRSELQSGFTGVEPKYKKQMDKLRYNYCNNAGEVFTSRPVNRSSVNVTIESLRDHYANQMINQASNSLSKSKVNTLILHDLIPANQVLKPSSLIETKEAQIFHDLLTTPSAGSMNFVKHLKKTENVITDNSKERKSNNESQNYVPAAKILSEFNLDPKKFLSKKESKLPDSPLLGRGLIGENSLYVDLDSNMKTVLTINEKKMIEAIKKVKEMGGLKRENPNSIKKDKAALRERVKRKLSQISDIENNTDDGVKRKKLFNNIDPQDERIKQILNAKSVNVDLVNIVEQEKEDEYFSVLEKTEFMEQAMMNIKEIQVNAVSCKICNYTAESASDLCREQNHKVIKHKAKKRFFACLNCKKRTVSLLKIPKHSCKHCGHESFERVGMKPERKGPKVGSEELLLRGEERKFINS